MEEPVKPVSSGDEDGSVGSSNGINGPDPTPPQLATSGDSGNQVSEPTDECSHSQAANESVTDDQCEGASPATLTLLERLRAKRLARDSRMWDVEDADLEAAQLTEVELHINRGSSDASDDLSSTDSTLLCPITRAMSSVEFDKISSVPYHAQYQRVVEQEEDAEMERLLRQLEEEQQAMRDLAVAQRYQLMQEQIAVIQKQLGRGDSNIPDLEWLMANDPENNQELDEVMAAFAARDDDLPQEAPEEPEIPLTCKNIFCRCPWRGDMKKDEKALAPAQYGDHKSLGGRPYACSETVQHFGLQIPVFRAFIQHPLGPDTMPPGYASVYRLVFERYI